MLSLGANNEPEAPVVVSLGANKLLVVVVGVSLGLSIKDVVLMSSDGFCPNRLDVNGLTSVALVSGSFFSGSFFSTSLGANNPDYTFSLSSALVASLVWNKPPVLSALNG